MQPAPRARAVAGAPVDALLARADELARRWAIALILALPLERIGEFPLESFARQAPLLCAHVVRALQSDLELERIAPGANGGREPSPARRLAEVTGARDGRAAVQAVEALRGVLWEALLDEVRWHGFDQSPARDVADLADRLAYVCSSALVSSLAQPAQAGAQAVAVGDDGNVMQRGDSADAEELGGASAPLWISLDDGEAAFLKIALDLPASVKVFA